MKTKDETVSGICSDRLKLNEEPIILDFNQLVRIFNKNKKQKTITETQDLTEYFSNFKKAKEHHYITQPVKRNLATILLKDFSHLTKFIAPNKYNEIKKQIEDIAADITNLLLGKDLKKTIEEKINNLSEINFSKKDLFNNSDKVIKNSVSSAKHFNTQFRKQINDLQMSLAAFESITSPEQELLLLYYLGYIELGAMMHYQQSWKSEGYRQGELVNSFSLAPGEELNLELFSWNRKKYEQERISESSSENTVSGKIMNHVALDVVTSAEFRMKGNVGGNLPLEEMGIPGSIDAGLEGELSAKVQVTQKKVQEATRSASNTIRAKRQLKIVENEEIGYESRNTRKIKNENRCHTLNYNYYQILEEFSVSVKPVNLQYVALIPLPPIPDNAVDQRWVLCHEGVLKRNLLDNTYLEGFNAAMKLESERLYKLSSSIGSTGNTNTTSSDTDDSLRSILVIYFDKIKESKDTLNGYTATNDDYDNLFNIFNSDKREEAYNKLSKVATKNFLLSVHPNLFSDIEKAYAFINDNEPRRTGKDIATYLNIFKTQYVKGGIMNLLSSPVTLAEIPLFFLRYDDEGLLGALGALFNELENLSISLDTENAANATLPSAVDESDAQDYKEYNLMELAQYEVEWNRLRCHIIENKDYYRDIIFSYSGTQVVKDLLSSSPELKGKVDNRLLTVQNGFAALPLIQTIQDEFRTKLHSSVDNIQASEDTYILPTEGTVMEAYMGECKACEEFINDHRGLDVEMKQQEVNEQTQKVSLMQQEVKRYEKRLEGNILDDPADSSSEFNASINYNNSDDNG